MHHREMIARHMPHRHFIHIEILVPPVWAEVRPVVKQEQSMALGIRLRPRIGREVADAVLAPDCRDFGAEILGNRLGSVITQRGHRSREMWQKPRRDLGRVAIAEEADGGEPGVESLRESFNGDGTGGVNNDQVLDLLAGFDELIYDLEGDHTAC